MRDTILLVDDMELNRAILRELLQDEYNFLEAENGEQAMLLLTQYHENIAAMLLDVVMPIKDGYQVLVEMGRQGFLNEVPVVVITAEGSAEGEVRSFDLGASDIIMKPFEPHVVRRRVKNIIDLNRHKRHLEELVEEQAQSLRESNEVMTDALASVIEYRSAESGQHVLRIRMFTKLLLQNVAQCCPEYGLDNYRVNTISRAAAMHDIGKVAIPDSVLNKPGPLTPEEREIMKNHTVKGCEMLDSFSRLGDREYLRYAYNICRYHHERWDGSGYPDGLKGDAIPLSAQAVSIADCYDALTNDRVYKKAYSHERAVNMILNGECGPFSPKLLECFKNVVEQFRALAAEYADGRQPDSDFSTRETVPVSIEAPDAFQAAQAKYAALLRYMDRTAVEIDLDKNICHMVFAHNDDFELLRTGNSLSETLYGFFHSCVHPDDQKERATDIQTALEYFFKEGMMRYTWKYRVFHRATGDYHLYRGTILRVDVDNPRVHRAMLIWEDVEGRDGPEAGPLSSGEEIPAQNIPGGVFKCRNDRRYTILRMNESFTSMFGYSKQELEEQFHNSFREMIAPEDLQGMEKEKARQFTRGNTLELEYRVHRKDGSYLWVLEKSKLVEEEGEERLYCVLVDISRTKAAQEELRLTLERHRIITNQTNDIVFEWDLEQDRMSFSANWEKKFGYEPIEEHFEARLSVASHFHPDDKGRLMELLEQLRKGLSYGEVECRVAQADGRYRWCKMRATLQLDAGGRPIKVVGVVLDIDSEKRQTEKLKAKAEQDTLTGLLNKDAARSRVEAYLERPESGGLSALLILDVDNFKMVNDSYGHMFGDAVLTRIAEQIRGTFRGGDFIARIGGDEFLVFMPGIPDRRVAMERSSRLLSAFEGLIQGKLEDCGLSCSIGIAYTTGEGEGFQELFQKADQALYEAKGHGKACYMVHDRERMLGALAGMPEGASALGASIDSDEQKSFSSESLVQYVFQWLYQSGGLEEAVNAILKLVGEHFDVSRAYIFEDDESGEFCSNTFEWCNEGVEPQKEKLAKVSYMGDVGRCYMECFNENGIFYCPDVSQLPEKQYELLAMQDIKSLLQCAIRDNGRFRGFVGFDENRENRFWTKEQIDALTMISEMLSVFLLKKRAQDKTETAAEGMRMALDNQSAWIYIIDPDTYQMYFINNRTRQLAPDAEVGMTCYKAFFQRDSPCEQCPAKDIRRAVNHTLEIYNPMLRVWSEADASLIKWEGKDACMLSCHDITKFKKQEP